MSTPETVAATQTWADAPLPDALWQDLAALPVNREDPEASCVYIPD